MKEITKELFENRIKENKLDGYFRKNDYLVRYSKFVKLNDSSKTYSLDNKEDVDYLWSLAKTAYPEDTLFIQLSKFLSYPQNHIKDIISKIYSKEEVSSFKSQIKTKANSKNLLCRSGLRLGFKSANTKEAQIKRSETKKKNWLNQYSLSDFDVSSENPDLILDPNQSLEDIYETKSVRYLCKKCGHITIRAYTDTYKCSSCSTCFLKEFESNNEKQIQELLSSLGVKWEKTRKLIPPYEIDIYLPDYKIAFEINGFYWHSYPYKPKNYHKIKTELCMQQGIRLYHFWQDMSWEHQKSFILNLLNKTTNKIQARQTQFEKISRVEAKEFNKLNHYQHDNNVTNLNYSLKFNNEIISVVGIQIKKDVAELNRYTTKQNYVVIGGFQKLLNHIKKELIPLGVKKIVTYANRDLTPDLENNTYIRNGFHLVGFSGLMLRYYVNNSNISRYPRGIYFRGHFMKHKLKLLGLKFDSSKTEIDNLIENDIFPVYNSGNYKYELDI